MKRFIQGESRNQIALQPESLDDSISEDSQSVVEAFIDELDLCALACSAVCSCSRGASAVYPSVLLKLYRLPSISAREGQFRVG